MKYSTFLLLLTTLICSSLHGFAQNDRGVTGKVIDSAGAAIESAVVTLTGQKDTLKFTTRTDGKFAFNNIKSDLFTLSISMLNYETYTQLYAFDKKQQLNVEAITLQPSYHTLDEVVIQSSPNPMRIMKDTVEFNAAAFSVMEGDNVADLLKQLQGLKVDENYGVQFMGKEVVKIRVNGKDFFTSNVQEFIDKLPAGIVSKIQIIDDYGDQANFTGVKLGQPKKMLNIVTKAGMNRGSFGNMSLKAGTNKQVGARNGINLWRGDKQMGGTGSYSVQDRGAGNTEGGDLSFNYRNKLAEKGSFSLGYSMLRNKNAYRSEQAIETVSSSGTYYNRSLSNGKTENSGHDFNASINAIGTKLFLNGSINATYHKNSGYNDVANNQTGVTRQDVYNTGTVKGQSPNIGGNIAISRILNESNMISVQIGFHRSATQGDQSINTRTLYYDQQTGALRKDSVLNRNIHNENNSQGFNFSTDYALPIAKPGADGSRKSINFHYEMSLQHSRNSSATYVLNSLSKNYSFVDSLSTAFTSLIINQTIGASYQVAAAKNQLTIGVNARPVIMKNNYVNLKSKINNNNFNYSPYLNLISNVGESKILTVNYAGNNSSPSPEQLQPVRNTQNLQNIIIGNPNLKPFFTHSLDAGYNYASIKTGASLLVAANFSTTQNEIVQNVIVIPDTLGSYKQETRYENTNGSYNVQGNYAINIPFRKNKYSVTYGGSLGVSSKALFINDTRYFNTGLNFMQRVSGSINLKKLNCEAEVSYSEVNNNNISTAAQSGIIAFNPGQLTSVDFFVTKTFSASANGRMNWGQHGFNTGLAYSYSANASSSVNNSNRDLQTWSFLFTGHAMIKNRVRVEASVSKRINSGYAIAAQNPLLLGCSIGYTMLKNRDLTLAVSGNDLLNQGNAIQRAVYGNSVIDSKNNVVTRVFTIELSYKLSRFGPKGTHMRVDPD